MVRPLIAPMAEAAAETRFGKLKDSTRYLIRAHAAGVDNVALFFGEDIFIAIASILLVKGFLEQNGIIVEPLHLSLGLHCHFRADHSWHAPVHAGSQTGTRCRRRFREGE